MTEGTLIVLGAVSDETQGEELVNQFEENKGCDFAGVILPC